MRVLRSGRRNWLVWELRFLVPQSREDDNENEVPEFPIPQCEEGGNEDEVPELVPIIEMEIVCAEFVFSNPFGGMGDMGRARSRGFFGEDILNAFRNSSGGGESSNNMLKKGSATEQSLVYSLEDLFMGMTKKMKLSRDVIDSNGVYVLDGAFYCLRIFADSCSLESKTSFRKVAVLHALKSLQVPLF
ncbi:hypothetical protein Syun_023695 [Stephania yunnanensis]|uniref:Uncharacterized protein n=1 Tax=Stephania yunnanensis TaxID=152371 RepID=A0AAP0I3V6_9MAGN